MGEVLANAGLNTLMGMGVVFVVLILISLLISAFQLVNKLDSIGKKKNVKPAEPVKKEAPPVVEEVVSTDDTELVAVIAAAIAAYEGTSPDGIVVRSIRKVSQQKSWKRG